MSPLLTAKQVAPLLNVSEAGVYRLRATCATHLEADISDVQAMLGHQTPQMTLGHYRSAVPERQKRAVSSLEDLFSTEQTNHKRKIRVQ